MTLKEKFEGWWLSPSDKSTELELLELEKVADDFAIGFAEWILEHRAKNILLRNNPTTKELLEIYKKEKGL
jgi:hypothetical protein